MPQINPLREDLKGSRRLYGLMAETNGNTGAAKRVLIVRGSFASLGGAERELLQLIRATSQRWEVSLASLDLTKDAEELLNDADVRLLLPSTAMKWPAGAVAEITAKASTSAQKMWQEVNIPWNAVSYTHLTLPTKRIV